MGGAVHKIPRLAGKLLAVVADAGWRVSACVTLGGPILVCILEGLIRPNELKMKKLVGRLGGECLRVEEEGRGKNMMKTTYMYGSLNKIFI